MVSVDANQNVDANNYILDFSALNYCQLVLFPSCNTFLLVLHRQTLRGRHMSGTGILQKRDCHFDIGKYNWSFN